MRSKKRKNQKNHNGGNPIRGSLKVFQACLDPILKNAKTNEGFHFLREALKDAVALRMCEATQNPLAISDECLQIIQGKISDEYAFSFVRCTLEYYSGSKEHKVELNKSCPGFKSPDRKKSLKHAQQDCHKCAKYYLGSAEKYPLNHVTKEQLKSTKYAIDFFADYIYELSEGKIPSKLKEADFHAIKGSDPYIKKLYIYQETGGFYVASERILYKDLSLETATRLFCCAWRYE